MQDYYVPKMDLNEARKNLDTCLGEERRKEYFALLRQWICFKTLMTKMEFDAEVRKILVNEEQIRSHNQFILALLTKKSTTKVKTTRSSSDKGVFESADYTDYIQPSSPTMLPPSEYESCSAAAELFMPDPGFMSIRIAVAVWENGLDGAEDNVTEIMVHICQAYVKNILTAMISRKNGYKVRDGMFQYGFNLPVPDPFIKNYHNVIDETQESKVEVVQGDDTFIPRSKPSLEIAEQQAAFTYSCAKRQRGDNTLSVKLLYETLRENPRLLGFYDLHNINLLKLGLQLQDQD